MPKPRINRQKARIGRIPTPRFVSPQRAQPIVATMIIISSSPTDAGVSSRYHRCKRCLRGTVDLLSADAISQIAKDDLSNERTDRRSGFDQFIEKNWSFPIGEIDNTQHRNNQIDDKYVVRIREKALQTTEPSTSDATPCDLTAPLIAIARRWNRLNFALSRAFRYAERSVGRTFVISRTIVK